MAKTAAGARGEGCRKAVAPLVAARDGALPEEVSPGAAGCPVLPFGLALGFEVEVGGGAGVTLTALNVLSPGRRIAYVYWLSLAAVVIAVLVTYLIMRSRLGLGFTAIRDDATAAGSLGVRVTSSKRIVYLVSSMGCALAGSMIAANTLHITPESVYSVQYSAFMIFIVVIGGMGTIEGPIIGAIVFYALQQWLSDYGVWYLVILGVLAIVVVLLAPRGLWGLLSINGRIKLFPVGYRLVNPLEKFSVIKSKEPAA